MVILNKVKKRIWYKLISFSRKKPYYPFLYKSYWNFLFNKVESTNNSINYYTAIPNPGAGIGHQIANWVAGYWFAKQFGLSFAHIPFSSIEWDLFLGFGENEINVNDLVIKNGYKKVLLPLFNENNENEIELIKKIINSYQSQKVVFIAEQDQFYRNQIGNMEDLKRKFYYAKSRKYDELIFSKECFNIALHIRRGDISVVQQNNNPNLLMRWQDNDYFVNVLKNVKNQIETIKPIKIYLFSQGHQNEFIEFEKFGAIEYCLDMDPKASFLHMVYADLLITSKSSFSYKPALLSNGIKIVPNNFWHGYPNSEKWILADENGNFNYSQLKVVDYE